MTNPLTLFQRICKKMYHRALSSIAFYPVLISIIFMVLAVVIFYIEKTAFIASLNQDAPYLFIGDEETARTLLSTLAGGILSLTVFSFTMVMLVLNQASANFSPRLLPGLVSNKRHQIILGLYIGTLLYCILVLISQGTQGGDSELTGLSTTLAAIFGVICVAVFVYFIHTISGAIQIRNIIDRIHKSTDDSLNKALTNENEATVGLKMNDSEGWSEIKTIKSGYFRRFDANLLDNTFQKTAHHIEVVPYIGQHVWEGDTILRSAQHLSESEIKGLQFCIDISPDRHTENDATGGMIQLMEIAVKALSPGINDPGTAIVVVSHLGELMVKSLHLPRLSSQLVAEGPAILIRNNIAAAELVRLVFQPIRNYAKQDSAVLYELINVLKYAHAQQKVPEKAKEAFQDQFVALRHDIDENITNPIDKTKLLEMLEG